MITALTNFLPKTLSPNCTTLKKATLLLFVASYFGTFGSVAFAQSSPETTVAEGQQTITGKVVDADAQPVAGAAVSVNGTVYTTSTDAAGVFTLVGRFDTWPAQLIIARQGFVSQEMPLEAAGSGVMVTLDRSPHDAGETTWAASKREENTFKVPITLDHLSADRIARDPAADPVMGALGRLRGVDISSNSLLINTLSTRGFNATHTTRVVQLVDGVDTQLPSFGLNLGNALGASPLDIATVDLIHGPSSTFYGVNAFNGAVVMATKDAFQTPGLSVALRGGQRAMQDAQLRYATRLSSRLAVKVNLSYLKADDWTGTNDDAQRASVDPLNNVRDDLRGYNAVSRYGDVGQIYGVEGGALYQQRVYMPGWREQETIGNDAKAVSIRLNPSVSYIIGPNLRATYEYRFNRIAGTMQTSERYRLDDVDLHLHRLELRGAKWAIQAYRTQESGKGIYNLNQLGATLQNQLDPSTNGQQTYAQHYFSTYQQQYNSWLTNHPGDNLGAQQAANTAAAPIQLSGSSAEYTRLHDLLEDTPVRQGGVQLPIRSALSDVSGQYGIDLPWVNLQVGGNFRHFSLRSDQSLFTTGTDQENGSNTQYGAYAEASKALLDRRLRLTAAGRFDGFKNFDAVFSPRLAALMLLGPNRNHALRASFGQAYTAPTQIQQYVNLALPDALQLGNIGQGFAGYTLKSLQSGTDLTAAQVNYKPLALEKALTVEAGYRTLLAKRLQLDFTAFSTRYDNLVTQTTFVGNADGSRPAPAQLATVGQDGATARVIQTWYNAPQRVNLHGLTVDARWFASDDLTLWGNYTLFDLQKSANSQTSSLGNENPVSLFSAPRYKVNAGLSGSAGALRYDVAVRWVDAYEYSSPFAAVQLGERTLLDAQLTYAVAKTGLNLSVGGTNLANATNVSLAGGPSLGRQLFAGMRFDLGQR